ERDHALGDPVRIDAVASLGDRRADRGDLVDVDRRAAGDQLEHRAFNPAGLAAGERLRRRADRRLAFNGSPRNLDLSLAGLSYGIDHLTSFRGPLRGINGSIRV